MDEEPNYSKRVLQMPTTAQVIPTRAIESPTHSHTSCISELLDDADFIVEMESQLHLFPQRNCA